MGAKDGKQRSIAMKQSIPRLMSCGSETDTIFEARFFLRNLLQIAPRRE